MKSTRKKPPGRASASSAKTATVKRAASGAASGAVADISATDVSPPGGPRKRATAGKRRLTTTAMIDRVERTLAREIRRIESILADSDQSGGEGGAEERRARTLASLARTLNEVMRLREEDRKTKVADDDTVPRDLDEFRRELSRRLDILVAEATAAHPEPDR